MVTGASTADLAVLLVDARKGVLTQTRRHSYLAHLIGIRHFVLAVTKMDLVDFDQAAFEAIAPTIALFADSIGIDDWVAIPVSGLKGDNVMAASAATPWYRGPSLIEHLDTVPLDAAADAAQAVPDAGAVGQPAQPGISRLRRPNRVRDRRAGRRSARAAVGPADADRADRHRRRRLDEAGAGQSVTVTFADEVDCSRGDVVAAAADPPQVADQFEATIVWMAEDELMPGRGYWLKLGTQTVTATVQHPKYEINVNSARASRRADAGVERDRRRRDRDRPRDHLRALCGRGLARTARSAASS